MGVRDANHKCHVGNGERGNVRQKKSYSPKERHLKRYENDIQSSDLPRDKSIKTNLNMSKKSQASALTYNSNKNLYSGSESSIGGYKRRADTNKDTKVRDLSPDSQWLNPFLQPPKRGLTMLEKKQRKLKEIKMKIDGFIRNNTLKDPKYLTKKIVSHKSMEDSMSSSFSSSNFSAMSKKP